MNAIGIARKLLFSDFHAEEDGWDDSGGINNDVAGTDGTRVRKQGRLIEEPTFGGTAPLD